MWSKMWIIFYAAFVHLEAWLSATHAEDREHEQFFKIFFPCIFFPNLLC